jgi:signal peptidase I
LKPLRFFGDIVLYLLAFTFTVTALLFFYYQCSLLTVTSRSMEPTIKAGDTVLTIQIPTSQIQKNDVLVLPLPEISTLRYAHRVIEVSNEAQEVIVRTKGDSNPIPDKWALELISKQVPKVVAVIPTSPILNGPVERRTIYLGLQGTAILLALLGLARLFR